MCMAEGLLIFGEILAQFCDFWCGCTAKGGGWLAFLGNSFGLISKKLTSFLEMGVVFSSPHIEQGNLWRSAVLVFSPFKSDFPWKIHFISNKYSLKRKRKTDVPPCGIAYHLCPPWSVRLL